jgi:hypothetical protein
MRKKNKKRTTPNFSSLETGYHIETVSITLSINSVDGPFRISKNTLGGKGSFCVADLANISACLLPTLGIYFFTENPSKELSILRTISRYFSKVRFFVLLVLATCQ